MEQNQQEQSEENKNDSATPSGPKKETSYAQAESTTTKKENTSNEPQIEINLPSDDGKKNSKWNHGYTITLLTFLLGVAALWINSYRNNKQFIASNKPRLQMINVHFDEVSLKSQPLIFFQLENLGNYPTEVLHAEWGWTIGDATDPRPWEKYQEKMINTIMPFAVSKERPFNQKITLIDFDTTTVYIMRHILNPFYLFGNFFYHDQIADIDMVYKVVVQVKLDGSFTYVTNENKPVP